MKIKIAVITGMLALVASSAFAAAGATWFGVQGGIASPTGDYSDFAKMGWQGTLKGTYMVMKEVGVGVDVGFHSWKGNEDTAPEFKDLKLTAIQADAHVMYMIPAVEKIMPYVKVGGGIYNVKTKLDVAGGTDESKSKPGMNFGAGLNYEVSPMYAVGVDAGYHIIFGGDYFVNTSGNKFNPSLFTVGVNLLFGMGGK